MNATDLTVQLPTEDVEFLEAYAKEHATSVAEMIARYAKRLQTSSRAEPHPRNLKLTGTIPSDVDAQQDYRDHLDQKHR